MGRRHDDERTRENRTRRYPGGYEGQRGYDGRGHYQDTRYGPYYDREGRRFYEDDYGHRYYDDRYDEDRHYRERDREREHYLREREQRQETRRTGMWVVGAIAIAVIALIGVMAVTGDDSSQIGQQSPQQPAPQQAPEQPEAPSPQAPSPQAPAAPQQPDGASAEQVEGLRADLERQLAEIRSSINQLRLEIWSLFTSEQQQREDSS